MTAPEVEQFARNNADRVTVVGIGDGFDIDATNDFLATNRITFTALLDTPDLSVTSHYDIRNWSEFWLLDIWGNRSGNQPLLFDTATAQQLLPGTTPHPHPPRTWELGYLQAPEVAR